MTLRDALERGAEVRWLCAVFGDRYRPFGGIVH